MRNPHIAWITIVVAIALAGTQASAASFSAGLVLPADSTVTDMTADGTTIVGTIDPSGGGYEAFRMDNGIVTILGDLAGGPVASDAYAVSGDGSVVVGIGEGGAGKRAVYWDDTDTIIALSTAKSEAYEVNFDGTVIVGKVKSGPKDQAVRWDLDSFGNITEFILGDLGGDKSEARGVSDDGEYVVGKGTNLSGDKVALLWDSSGAITEIGDLLGGKGDAVGTAVTFDGFDVIVVGQADTAAGKEAFRWDSGTQTMVSLGDLAGGKTDAIATGISADGSIIVGMGTGVDGKEAFIWLESDGIMRSLKDYLINEMLITGIDDWTFDTIVSISADGRTITGPAENPAGETQFFTAQIPEPSTATLMILGMVGIAWVGRPRSRPRPRRR